MKHLFTLLILFVSALTMAQETTGSIIGVITDKEMNNDPLPFANVQISGATKGTTTDMDGLYEISGITPGTYTIVISFIGYETLQVPNIKVEAGKVTELNTALGAGSVSLDEVVVTTTARRDSETALLLDQKKAVEIKTSIGAQELSRKGVSDAAGAVAKISGVSKQEGSSNVYVRGLGDRYLNTTLNGLSLPSNDVNKKNIDLDLFSSDIIESVSVSKAYSTGQYGDFSAGNIDVSSKVYKGKQMFEIALSESINTNAIGEDFVRSEGTGFFGYYGRYDHNPFAVVLSHGVDPVSVGTPINISYGGSAGKTFEFSDTSRLSIFLTGSFDNKYEYREGSAVDYTLTEKKAFEDNAKEYDYSTTTTGMANVNYRINDQNTLQFNSLFINNSSDVVGYFGTDGKGRSRDAILNTDEGFYQMNVQFDQTQFYVNQLIGTHASGKFKLDWGLGYNVVYSDQPDRKRITLENYQYALDDDTQTNPTFYSNTDFDNQRYFQKIEDEEYNGRFNLAYDLSEAVKFNFGYNARSKTRGFSNIRYGYDIIDTSYPVTDVNNINEDLSLEHLNIADNPDAVYELTVINNIEGQSNTNRPGLAENTYDGKLDIYAGYVNAEINIGKKLLVTPGVRLESFNQEISFDVINLGSLGNSKITSYDNFVLPSLNIKYGLTENQNLRFSASKTVSIPEFKEVAPFVYEDISTRVGGNPDLLEKGFSKIYNFDLKYEWFISPGEIFSISAFTKQINDPVNLVVGADATGTQRYFRTGDKAEVYGVELEARKDILKNSNTSSLLSFGLNGTYMHTKQDLYSQIDGEFYDVSFQKEEDELQGASPFIMNADLNFSPVIGENYKPSMNVVFNYFSNRIDALGSGQLGNIIEKGIPTLDFIWRNEIKDSFQVNLSVRNLFNPSIKYYRETTLGDVVVNSVNGKGVSDYKRGLDIGLQLKYQF
ncbi:TonB-dependent receptor domain-containing protein [Joostella sp.]|uniref:TonB-dependent receptor n=1 Tax=Joostella sp. TaxID=2231138 RepID=UPI003A908FBA